LISEGRIPGRAVINESTFLMDCRSGPVSSSPMKF
jgi:hypothetical protein